MVQVQDAFSPEQDKYITVTQLSNAVKDCVEQSFGTIYLKGEISGFKKASSGHYFFTLKDETSSVSACIWKSTWPSILASVSNNMKAFQDGVQVLAECKLNVYPRNTSISVVVTKMTPAGLGDLAVKPNCPHKAVWFTFITIPSMPNGRFHLSLSQ